LDEPNNAEDAEHLSALSIAHYILAGLTALNVLPLAIFASMGSDLVEQLRNEMALTMGDLSGQTGVDPFGGAPGGMMQDLTSLMTAATALSILLVVVTAVGFFLVGLKIRQRQWWTFCYLSAWGECLVFPFGTILGVFSIIVLSRPSVKRAFGMD
jgi:hypothetical protein